MSEKPRDQPPMVIASQWAARITTLAFEMVIPGLVGVWADRRLGTVAVFTLVGFALGGTLAVWQLIRVAGESSQTNRSADKSGSHEGPNVTGQSNPRNQHPRQRDNRGEDH